MQRQGTGKRPVIQLKNGTFLLIFFGIILLCAGILLLGQNRAGSGGTARIYLDGQLICEQPLDALKAPKSVQAGGGNTVELSPDGARMLHANCPDQVCVRQGRIHSGLYPIVCLPNRVVVRIENAGGGRDVDAVSGQARGETYAR